MIRTGLAGALVALALSGCAKKRISECDSLAKTVETIGVCSKVPTDERSEILDSAKIIRDALKEIDEAGGVADAPADLVSSMRDACKTQDASLKEMYADCLK